MPYIPRKLALTAQYRKIILLLIAALERKVAPESAKIMARETLLRMAEAADLYMEQTRPRREYRRKGGK